ncbi:MAG: class 1 fructose-bisphosphatase [Paracoccaceae bacterium]|nr:MAG: class 1 fructose-bisphosphatase [Paracoccaceae bacterium]
MATDGLPDGLADLIGRIADVCADLALRIARGGIDEHLGGAVGTNPDGDGQKALDVIADDLFRAALAGSSVRWYASEEQDDAVAITPQGAWGLAIDPLDGSSNIDVNVSIGTIFGIYPATDSIAGTFLRPGRDLVAAGYAIYGPQCCLVLTTGSGVRKYVLDPASRRFTLVDDAVRVPADSTEFSINASNYRHWQAPVRAYIDDLVAGIEGPRGRNSNMRWVASLVAETHRILTRGGIFLYPRDDRPGYENGRLRHVYECAPIAMVMEQAGAAATDGTDPILDRVPAHLHARAPFVFGSVTKVARVTVYHDLPHQETSALFSKRGLFRS